MGSLGGYLRHVDAAHIGEADAWTREAWRVCLLTAELDLALDDDALIYDDVYDLRALGARLRAALTEHPHARHPSWGRVSAWVGHRGRAPIL